MSAVTDESDFADQIGQYREQLERFIVWRLTNRLWRYVDAEDVFQEVQAEAWRRLHQHQEVIQGSFYLWLRRIAQDRCVAAFRKYGKHLDNVALGGSSTNATHLAAMLAASVTSPSTAAQRMELTVGLEQALAQMSDTDREIITLRHFEHMHNKDIAELLEMEPAATSIRYRRAIERLSEALGDTGDVS